MERQSAQFRVLLRRQFRLWLAAFAIVLVAGGADPSKKHEDLPSQPIYPSLLKTFSVRGYVESFAFDSKRETLVTVGWNSVGNVNDDMDQWEKGTSRGEIRIWNVASAKEIARFGDEVGGIFDVAFSPNDRTIVTVGRLANSRDRGDVATWDAKTHKLIRRRDDQTKWVRCVAFSPDGKLVVSSGYDPTIRIWDAASGQEFKVLGPWIANLKSLNPWDVNTRSIIFSRDGKTLVAGSQSGTLASWKVGTWETLQSFKTEGLPCLSAALSPEGKYLAVGGWKMIGHLRYRAHVEIWDIAARRVLRVTPFSVGVLYGVDFSPNAKYFAATGSFTKVWALDTGDEVAYFPRPSEIGDHILFLPDGKTLAINGFHSVTLWDVSALSTLGRVKK